MTIVTRFEQNPNGTTPEKMNCKAILKYPMHGRTPDMIATLSYVAAETSARKTTFTYIQAKKLPSATHTNIAQVMHVSVSVCVIT